MKLCKNIRFRVPSNPALFGIIISLSALLAGCDGVDSASSAPVESTGSPLASILPTPTSTAPAPAVPSPPSSSDQPLKDPASQAIPAGSTPTTSAGGYYTITQTRTFTLETGGTVLGAASVGSLFYMLERVNVSGITRLKILSTPNQPGTGLASWTVVCNILADSAVRLGFTADSTYFYLPGALASDLNHDQYIRRFRQSDCVEVSTLDVGQNMAAAGYPNLTFSVASNIFYYSGNPSSPALSSFNLTTGLSASQSISPALGVMTLNYAEAAYVDTSFTWVMTYYDLWKLDHNGGALAWAALPSPNQYYSSGNQGVVSIDQNTLVNYVVSGSSFTRYYLDVSHF